MTKENKAQEVVRNQLFTFIRKLTLEVKEQESLEENSWDYQIHIKSGSYLPTSGDIFVKGKFRDNDYSRLYEMPDLGLKVTAMDRPFNNQGRVYLDLAISLEQLGQYLTGNDVEVDTAAVHDEGLQKRDWYWNTWKDIGLVGSTYSESIYPQVRKFLLPKLEAGKYERLELVDLFGGDGEFVERMLPSLERLSANLHCNIVDLNKPSLSMAQKRFAGSSTVSVHEPRDLTYEELFGGINYPPNVVTALGGLCADVLTRNEALSIANKVYQGVSPEGRFVLSGYTPILLNAADFVDLGFKVENMSVPANALDRTLLRHPYQLYILRK